MKAFGRKVLRRIRSTARNRLVRAGSMAVVTVLVAGLFVWFATPWPTLAARYAWGRWHAPRLALFLNQSDAALAMAVGNRYYGTVFAGNAVPLYDPTLAKRAYEQALAIDPSITLAHYTLARVAFTEGDLNEALREINAELDAHPENLRALYIRGLIYGFRYSPGDLRLAELDFSRFVEWVPTEWAGYNDLAWILAKEGKYAEIEHVITRAFEKVPGGRENPWLSNMLGVARLNQGDKVGAVEAFEKALEYAEGLTLADWRRAYSGNSPAGDQAGLDAFLDGIRTNLSKARASER